MVKIIRYIGRGRVVAVVFDVSTSRNKTLKSKITNHPIESGATITDHIAIAPTTMQVEAIVSDSAFFRLADDPEPLGLGRSDAARTILQDMSDAGEVFDIQTADEVLENVAFVTLSMPKNKALDKAHRFNFTVQQIRTVERSYAILPATSVEVADMAQNDEQKGAQKLTEEEQETVLFQLLEVSKTVVNGL